MPSTETRLRNTGEPVHVYAPEEDPASILIGADEVLTVNGSCEELQDCFVIGDRAYPKSRWAPVSAAPPKPADQAPAPAKKGDL